MQFFKRSPQQVSWSLLGHMTYISLNYRPVSRSIWKKVVPWQIVWFYTRRWLTSARWSNNNNLLKVQAIVSSKSMENSTKVSNRLSIARWVSTSDSTQCNGTSEENPWASMTSQKHEILSFYGQEWAWCWKRRSSKDQSISSYLHSHWVPLWWHNGMTI